MKYSSSDLKALTTWQAAVLIPALQAGITGLHIGIIAGSVAWIGGGDALKWAILAGAISGLLAWWAGVTAWRDAVYQATQEPPKVDQVETVRLEVMDLDNPQPWGHWLNLTIEPGAARQALTLLADGRDLSMAALSGRGNPLSRTEFVTLRDALINSGLAYWQNPRSHSQGCALSVGGRSVLQRYSNRLPAHPQNGNGGEVKLITG